MKHAKKSTASTVIVIIIALVILIFRGDLTDTVPEHAEGLDTGTSATTDDDARIVDAFSRNVSGIMVTADGLVATTLSDDNDGSRHQRFIVRLDNDHTVLVAHNIDLAPRVPLREGDRVIVHGQFEWNADGGVVHWTHHDPGGRRAGGWIRHDGERYE